MSLTLADDRTVRLGRGPDNHVAFDPRQDLAVSTHHAELRIEAGGLRLTDLGSANGTYVAGQRISSHLLAPGQTITFGHGGPQVAVALVPGPAPVAPAPVAGPSPVAPPGPVAPAPVARPAPVAPVARRAPAARPGGKGKGWLLALLSVLGLTGAGITVAVLLFQRPEAESSGSGSGSGTGQAARSPASADERRWLEDVDLLVSPGAPPREEELQGATLLHREGAVVLRGAPSLRRLLRGVRVAAVPVERAERMARDAYTEAKRSGAYVLGQPIVSIEAGGGQRDRLGRLFVTLPLSSQQLAAATDDAVGALYLTRSGAQFVFGRLDRAASAVTIATAHLSAYSGAVVAPSRRKQTWTEWAKSWAPSRAAATGYWTPKCEPPLIWTRVPSIRKGDARITPNGCSVPDVAAAAHWATTMRAYKKFVSKDNPSGLCDIKSACDAHDECYVVCGKAKEACDTAFTDSLVQLADACIASLPDDGKLGEHIMHIRYWLVKYTAAPTGWIGRQLYKSAQQAVCECQATVVGKWTLDRDALLSSARDAAKAVAAQRGGSPEQWEPQLRAMFERVHMEMEFSESGAFHMRGKVPRWGGQRADGSWVLEGDRITLSNLSGSRFPSRLALIDGKIHVSAPDMNGMRWVLIKK